MGRPPTLGRCRTTLALPFMSVNSTGSSGKNDARCWRPPGTATDAEKHCQRREGPPNPTASENSAGGFQPGAREFAGTASGDERIVEMTHRRWNSHAILMSLIRYFLMIDLLTITKPADALHDGLADQGSDRHTG